jgi:hypothetical protein
MRPLSIRIAAAVLLVTTLFSVPTAAMALSPDPVVRGGFEAPAQVDDDDEHDVVPVATWSIVGTLIGALVLGVLYLFKRRVGGFPENPEWIAPISIERSETLPKEGDYGDVPADAHGAHH